jgi:predicted nucleotidyltransferase
MESFALSTSTGVSEVDNILRGTIGILETTFPDRIRAYYLHGSFADGSGIETSDIDLFLVSKGKFTPAEREKIQRIMHFSSLLSPFMVEMIALNEDTLLQDGHFRIKSASKLLWGEDLRESIPEQTLDQYLHMYAHFPRVYIIQMLRNSETVTYPLSYPQPTGEFYGYDQQLLPPANVKQHNIKKLVTCVCWIATILIAWQSGKTVTGKRASVEMYREYVNDEWTTFIEEVYEYGNRQWRYLVPQEPKQRQQLRHLCTQVLAFENHYLSKYNEYCNREV